MSARGGLVSDLEERLVMAATAAIRNERQALGYRPETIRGLTVEVTLGKAGGLADVVVYVERRTSAGALLDHQTVRAG
jgi:hypothetical protein